MILISFSMAEERCVCIKDLRPGMKNVTSTFIVIDKGTTNNTKDGSVVRKCRVADKTGSIFFSLWNEQAEAIESGDILKLTKGYASVWKGSLVLYSGKYGILEKIGEFTMLYSETPDMSECVPLDQGTQGTRGYTGGSRQDNPPLLSDGPPQQQHNLETTKLRSPPVPSMMDRSSPQAGGAMPLYPNNMSQPPLPRVARQHHQMQQQGPRPMDHQMPQQGPRPMDHQMPQQGPRPMDHQMPQQGPRPMDHQMHQQGPRPMDHQMPQQGPRPMDHQLPQQGPRPMDHQMHHQGPRPMDHQMHQQVPRPMDHQRFMLTTPRVDIRYQPYPPRAGGGGGGRPVALGNQLDGWM